MKIVLDLDGVVFDFVGGFVEFYNNEMGTCYSRGDFIRYRPPWGRFNAVMQRFGAMGWYARLEPLEGAIEAINSILMCHDVSFLTSRGPSYAGDTRAALKRFGLEDVNLRMSKDKGSVLEAIGADLFVDDNPAHCWEAKNVGVPRVRLMRARYNEMCWDFVHYVDLLDLECEVECEHRKHDSCAPSQ